MSLTSDIPVDWRTTVTNSDTFKEFSSMAGSCITNVQMAWPYNWTYCWCNRESKIEKAYTIVRALMKARIVQVKSLEKFFCLMDEVQKVL